MKKLLLSLLFIGLISGCSQPSIFGNGIETEKLKVDKNSILFSENIDEIKCERIGENCINKGKIKKYYFAGDIIPANIYKVNGKNIVEDISNRTATTETYCDGNNCVMKQFLADKYVKSDVNKILLSATTTIDNFDKQKMLLGEEEMFGSTATTSTNNADNEIDSANVNTNYGSATFGYLGYGVGRAMRPLFKFTLSSGSGTISAVKLYIYDDGNGATAAFEAHQLTRTNWTEAGSTWNKYDGTNNWTTAGGDFSSTIISHGNTVLDGNWWNVPLVGTGTDNPLTLTWGDVVNLLLKRPDENANTASRYRTKEHATTNTRPYIEITYSAVSAVKNRQQIIITE